MAEGDVPNSESSPPPEASSETTRGPRILLTRDAAGCERWAGALRRLGARPIVFPCLVLQPKTDPLLAAGLSAALLQGRWLCVTSARGVEAVSSLIAGHGGLPATIRVAAVGPATAARARELFGRVDFESTGSTARDLAEALWDRESSSPEVSLGADLGANLGPVVVATADRGRDEIERFLRIRRVAVRRVEVYSTVPAAPAASRESLLDILRRDPALGLPDVVTLASPSAFEGLCHRAELPHDLPLVTFGPTTTSAVLRSGATVAAEAKQPTLEALYEAVLSLDRSRNRKDRPRAADDRMRRQ